MAISIRPAEADDEAALFEIERVTWSALVSPAVFRERPFFDTTSADDVLVATIDGRVVGFVVVRPATALPSNAHVLSVDGLAVSPTAHRQGVGARLLAAVDERAAERNAERVRLRVLAVNSPARALYEKCGYRVEGVLEDEFRLPVGPDGELVAVDDLLMAKTVGG